MSNKNREFYNEQFYKQQANKSFESAINVLKIMFDIYKPNSIVDFGCGQGTWLAGAEKLGIKTLEGYDGEWVDKNKLYSKNIKFNQVNLEKKIKTKNKFDLAISLEVAEHLNSNSAKTFIQSICDSSDVILFGAAIKAQGGTNHINEQWQSYWIELFKNNKFICYDIIRPQIWNDDNIEWWYRQNIFLFIKESKQELLDKKVLENIKICPFNIVHPRNFEYRVTLMNNLTEQLKDVSSSVSQKQQIIQQKNIELNKKEQEIQNIKKQYDIVNSSKSFLIGNLFFRSIKKPYKLLTFPINFIKILLNK